jgi:hypothetical protein
MSIHCTIPLLFNSTVALSSFITHESPSTTTTTTTPTETTPISSLYHVLIASVHLVHEMCAIPLHNHTAPISSTSRVIFLIIATLQLLWWFSPRIQHHWVLCRDSFFSLAIETLRLLCYSRAHFLCFSYRLQPSSSCQSPLLPIFIPLEYSQRLFISSGRNHQWFLAVTL